MLLLWIVGAVVALVNWQRYPRPSLLLLLAMLDFAFFRLLGAAGSMLLVPAMRDSANPQMLATMMTVLGFVSTIGTIVGFGLLIAAVYIGRTPAVESNQYGPYGQLPQK